MKGETLCAGVYNGRFVNIEKKNLSSVNKTLCSDTVQPNDGSCRKVAAFADCWSMGDRWLELLTFFANKVPPHDPPPAR